MEIPDFQLQIQSEITSIRRSKVESLELWDSTAKVGWLNRSSILLVYCFSSKSLIKSLSHQASAIPSPASSLCIKQEVNESENDSVDVACSYERDEQFCFSSLEVGFGSRMHEEVKCWGGIDDKESSPLL